MTISLLQLIQDVCDELPLVRPTVVVGSNDLTYRQLFGLAKVSAEKMARSFPWEALQDEHTFVTVAAAVQTDSVVPADFQRFIPETFYNRTQRRKVWGPVTPQAWQAIQANPAANSIWLGYRKRTQQFLITPTPSVGQTIAFEYISNYYAYSSGGTAKATWTLDTDLTYLDPLSLKLDIKWRWKAAKGLPYAEDYDEAAATVNAQKANDGGAPILSMACDGDGVLMNPTIPQVGFGS